MKKLLEQAIVTRGAWDRPEVFQSPLLDFSIEKTGNERPYIDRCTEYVMSVTIGTNFWANKAQYYDAVKQARHTILARVFGEQRALIEEIRQATYSHDPHRILEACGQLEDSMKP